jgi:hypothetical protein
VSLIVKVCKDGVAVKIFNRKGRKGNAKIAEGCGLALVRYIGRSAQGFMNL